MILLVAACGSSGGGGDSGTKSRPRAITTSPDGTAFLLDPSGTRIDRWSMTEDRYLTPIAITSQPSLRFEFVYSSAHDRLYLGRDGGVIRRIDDPAGEDPIEASFTTTSVSRPELVVAGDFLVAAMGGSQNELVSFRQDGTIASTITGFAAGNLAFDAGRGRVVGYGTSYRIHRVEIDPVTGALHDLMVGPSRGSVSFFGDLFVSDANGDLVVESGQAYDATLTATDLLPDSFRNAKYLADGTLLTIRDGPSDDSSDDPNRFTTLLERWSADRERIDEKSFSGSPVDILEAAGEVEIVTYLQSRGPIFSAYTVGTDGDGDGIAYADDAFPLDPAASLDEDGDGAPDAWNPGASARRSTTGLVLDAFPRDSACQQREQALPEDRTRCDIARSFPDDSVLSVAADDDGIVYALGRTSRRIFRWSATEERHLNPIPIDEGASQIVHSSAHERLYVVYARGAVSQIDLTGSDETPHEHSVVRFPDAVRGLFEAGGFMIQSGGTAPALGVFDEARQLVATANGVATQAGAYDPGRHVLYHHGTSTSGGSSTVHATVIDPLTGALLSTTSLFSGAWRAGARLSGDGARIVFDGGEVRDTDGFTVIDRLPNAIAGAVWLSDGRLAVIGSGGDRRVLLFDEQYQPIDAAYLGGLPTDLVEAAGRLVAVFQQRPEAGPGRVAYQRYVPGTDGDGDGVPYEDDADPLDSAVSIDSDGDGLPDRWNDGYSSSARAGYVPLDAFPFDSACQSTEHAAPGRPDVCDEARRAPQGLPIDYAMDARGVVYLIDSNRRRIARYSLAEDRWLDPIWTDSLVRAIAYSDAHDRLYLGYESGLVERLDAGLPARRRRYFDQVERFISSLSPVGDRLLAVARDYHVLSAEGVIVSVVDDSNGASSPELVPATDRIYHVHDTSFPRRLHWLSLDPATGALGAEEEERNLEGRPLALPLRVSPDGRLAAFASGAVFDAESFEFELDLPVAYEDAAWQPGGGLVTLRDPGDGSSRVELWGADFLLHAFESFTGEPLRVLSSAGRIGIVRLLDGRPIVSRFTPSNDSDGDGVENEVDRFPLDPAASMDTDRDGAPDGWNPGRGPADSPQGLVLDAFPDDQACQLPEHGRADDPSTCDQRSGIPPYLPEDVVSSSDGVVYALSPENRRIYRWSVDEQHHLVPIPIGRDALHLTISDANQALYLAYDDGRLTAIDLNDPALVENDFAAVTSFPSGLQAIESLVLVVAREPTSTGVRHVVFDSDGDLLVDANFRDHASDFAWSPINQTLYYARGVSTATAVYSETVDPATGALGPKRSGPPLLAPNFANPIRVSQDGATVAMGSGRFFDGATLALLGSLPTAFVDGLWLANGSLLTIREVVDGQTTFERWSAERALLETWTVDGEPLRLLASGGGLVLVTTDAGNPDYQIVDLGGS